MIKCSKCGYENSEGGGFCSNCGQKLEKSCPRCGTKVPGGARFCFECGAGMTGEVQHSSNGKNYIAGDVTGSYNTSYTTTNIYNQMQEPDAECSFCGTKIPAAAKSTFVCRGCGKFFCANHLNSETQKCASCSAEESNAKFERYKAEIRMQKYDSALMYFKGAMSDLSADPDVYYYAAIAALRGRPARGQEQYVIDAVEKYIDLAIQNKPKGIYYYLLAYVKYDFYERNYRQTKPNYKEAFALAIKNGVGRQEIEEMYSLMRVTRPSCL
ncbi:MAG: zinc-ribbon domain-containing protein [Ruminococcaceae bacterium]|nr:zinc-ribbon domain-containing protein [Oscillospiraceae bacterium]